jgi:hypothetical protein
MRCVALLLFAALSAELPAQVRPSGSSTSPIMDMIDGAKNALNNLQYTQARTAAREVLALGNLKRSQEIAALQLASAAYFPDEPEARIVDSASYYIKRLVRLMPSGSLPIDLASAALDSQLTAARRTVFGAAATAPPEVILRGTESRPAINVEATRPARWQMFLESTGGGPPILLDTLSGTEGRLTLRAHSGSAPLIVPGEFRLRILSISTTEPDTITIRFGAATRGAVPALVPLPAAPSAEQLLPERHPKAIGAGIAGGMIVGGGTWAIANLLRAPDALKSESKDSRGFGIALGIGLGSIVGGLIDKGRPHHENIKKNAVLRTNYLKALGEATETNTRRIAEYALAMTIDPEAR